MRVCLYKSCSLLHSSNSQAESQVQGVAKGTAGPEEQYQAIARLQDARILYCIHVAPNTKNQATHMRVCVYFISYYSDNTRRKENTNNNKPAVFIQQLAAYRGVRGPQIANAICHLPFDI
jgi:hypothetical protein